MGNKYFLRSIITDLALGLGIALIFTGGILLFSGGERVQVLKQSQVGMVNHGGELDSRGLGLGFPQLISNYSASEEKSLVIPIGASGIEVAHLLAENEIIEAEDFLKLNIMFGFEKRIKAGRYRFTSDDGVSEVLAKILLKEVKDSD